MNPSSAGWFEGTVAEGDADLEAQLKVLQAMPTKSAGSTLRATWDYSQIKTEVAMLNRTGKLSDAATGAITSGSSPTANGTGNAGLSGRFTKT